MMDGCTRSIGSKDTRSILSRLFETVVEASIYRPGAGMMDVATA
jgi:hypothetical protein